MKENRNLIKRFLSSPAVQTFLIYVSSSWLVLEMTEYFINNYGLNQRIRDILLIIMLIGLPVAVFLTWYFSRDREESSDHQEGVMNLMFRRPWVSIPVVVIIGLLVFSAARTLYRHNPADTGIKQYANISRSLQEHLDQISLAVLPFTNFTGNPDQDWLVSGQQETLINELSKLSQMKPLRIISRSTVNAFKNYDKPVSDLAREIDVDYLVEASVMGSIDSVTLQLRLIKVFPEENVIWAESSTSDFKHIIKYHSQIAGKIADEIDLGLTPEEHSKLFIDREVNPESYKAYLRGMYALNQLTPGSTEKGLEYLHEAVRIDPADPFANAGLALGYLEIAHGPLDPGDALSKGEAAAMQAIRLDTSMAEIYAALAEIYLYQTWKYELSEENFHKALLLNPNLALTHYHYSWALYLWGRMEEAILEHQLAKRYDPFNPLHTAWLGALYCYNGQYEEAIMEAEKAMELNPEYPVSYYVLGITYLEQGREEEAIAAHQKVMEMMPYWSFPLVTTYVRTGHMDEARQIVEAYEQTPVIPFTAINRAVNYAQVGELDEAFTYLNFEPHHAWTAWAAVMPEFENMRNDPRFEEFLNRLNLPD
ncbi:MAG: tetratricopeptide repeat protein [Bacteroidales bacterium]